MAIFLIAFLLVLGLTLVGRPVAARLGLLDQPHGHKLHEAATPAIGGPVIFISVAVATLAGIGPESNAPRIVLGILPLMLLGLVDDIWRLRPLSRLIIQVAVVAQLIISSGVSFMNLGAIAGGGQLLLGDWTIPFTILALVGLINAINLVDGLDGLAAGLSFMAIAILLALAAILGITGGAMVMGLAAFGAIAGFLIFNLRHPWNPRASAFLGDSGSLLVGIILGALLYKTTQKAANPIAPVLGLWLLTIPLFDTCSVMIRRLVAGKNPMVSDRQHLHHLLLDAGLSHGRVVAILLAASFALGAGASILWLAGVSQQTLFIAYLAAAAAYLGFVMKPERAVARLRTLAILRG